MKLIHCSSTWMYSISTEAQTRAQNIWIANTGERDRDLNLDVVFLSVDYFSLLSSVHELQHELLSDYSSPCVDGDLHPTNLLVDIFHELDDEIDQLVLPQFLQVSMGHEKADVVSLDSATKE